MKITRTKGGLTMALPQKRTYTIDDIYALPEGQRAELFDGQMYMMAPPNRIHQELVNRLFQRITNHIDSKGGSCKVYPAPFAVFLTEDDTNYVEPDISVICDKNKLTDKGCDGAPDWIIEIVSPSSSKRDYLTKSTKYEAAGVREYWIVDPDKQRITIYRYEVEAAPMIAGFEQPIQSGIFSDLEITIADLLK